MAQLKEILEIERNRNGDNTSIHLFAEGMFYRAYEWSAWLCVRYVNEFKVTRRDMKNNEGDSIVFVGFPITSLGKFVPEDAAIEQGEGHVVLRLPIESHPELADGADLEEAFAHWKGSIPVAAAPKKSGLRDELKGAGGEMPRHMSEIMLSIVAFPIEQKTPIECMTYVADLKRQIANLL